MSGFVMLLAVAGCATSDDVRQERAERRQRAIERTQTESRVDLRLAAPADVLRSVQLYGVNRNRQDAFLSGADEAALPIHVLRGAPLTLEFDLMATGGKPLSIYFYHADRRWQRDLSPAQYLSGFQRDELLNYTISRGTQVPYVHYEYRFPNNRIGFELSGNYILRVTEQGDEEQVLFEQPFYVAEQAVPVDVALDNIMVGGQGAPSVQPIALFRPPPDLQGNVFDFNTCFVRNGRIEQARCADRPNLMQQPVLEFYLQPELAFEPDPADYFVDLGALRVGPRIASVDRAATPFEVVLEPDYARFSGSGTAPLLRGQSVISAAVQDVGEPDVAGEYVRTRFAYVPPDEQPYPAEVFILGSFNNWQIDPDLMMTWVPEAGRYEGEVLLKQGAYEYRYYTRDAGTNRELRANLPRFDNQYTAFVYYRDAHVNTDRLLAVEQVVAP